MVNRVIFQGLASLRRGLRKLDSELPRELNRGLKEMGKIVVQVVKPTIPLGPSEGGHVRNSLRVQASGRRGVFVVGGGARYPYYPWLEFGGSISKGRVVRERVPGGRYLYPGADKAMPFVAQELNRVVNRTLDLAGF